MVPGLLIWAALGPQQGKKSSAGHAAIRAGSLPEAQALPSGERAGRAGLLSLVRRSSGMLPWTVANKRRSIGLLRREPLRARQREQTCLHLPNAGVGNSRTRPNASGVVCCRSTRIRRSHDLSLIVDEAVQSMRAGPLEIGFQEQVSNRLQAAAVKSRW